MYNELKGADCVSNIPKGKKQVTITLPDDVLDIIDDIAESNYYKRAEQISRIVIDYIKQFKLVEDSK